MEKEIIKKFKKYFFLGVLEADKIDQSYGNRFKKGRIIVTQESLKSLELLEEMTKKWLK